MTKRGSSIKFPSTQEEKQMQKAADNSKTRRKAANRARSARGGRFDEGCRWKLQEQAQKERIFQTASFATKRLSGEWDPDIQNLSKQARDWCLIDINSIGFYLTHANSMKFAALLLNQFIYSYQILVDCEMITSVFVISYPHWLIYCINISNCPADFKPSAFMIAWLPMMTVSSCAPSADLAHLLIGYSDDTNVAKSDAFLCSPVSK
jgi:hypothetical protein